ncbi:MAG: succinate dehydrogenase, hydrophobic membrane anchor protein [Candidatus Sedimenticola sp. PURPLELP]
MSRQASGLRAWALQRISAVYLGLYLVYFLGYLLISPPESYEAWRSWVGDPWGSMAMLLFFTSLLLHAWVGVRDVLIDYIHPMMIRVVLLTLFGIGLIGSSFGIAKAIFLAGLPS